MRTAFTVGLIKGADTWEFLAGPETAIGDQRAAFKALRAGPGGKKYAEIQLWESDAGITLRHKFTKEAPTAVVPGKAADDGGSAANRDAETQPASKNKASKKRAAEA